jgi:RHS repeat-associated protein
LKKIINAKGGETNLGYNYFDWLISEQFGSNIKQYDYYDDGKLKKYTKPDNTAINYTYNAATQLLGTDGYTNFTYDSPRNRLKTVTYQSKVLTFNYDDLDRITSTIYDGNTVAYSYDKNNNVITITYPGSKIVTYTYDELDRMKTVKDWNNQITTYNYKKDSRLETVVLPNGVITTYYYDLAGRMTGYDTKKNTTIICQYTYGLDLAGSHTLESKQEPVTTYAGVTNANLTAQYDNQNRIITHGTKNFTFDANGCTKTKTGRTYNWDVYDRLTSVSGDFTALYEYDGLGNRRRAVRNGTATKFVLNILGMSQVLMETNDANVAQNYYVYGLGLISRIKPDNTTRYYHGDFRGSVVAMTDAVGSVTHKYQYDEFGTVLQKIEQDENRFRYVGIAGVQYEDSTLVFMRARYYDPEIGRFLSEDPIWSTNLYPYAGNNPVMNIDKDGKLTVLVGAIVGAGVGFTSQVLSNAVLGKPLLEDVLRSSIKGGISGGLAGAGVTFLLPLADAAVEFIDSRYLQKKSVSNSIKSAAFSGLSSYGGGKLSKTIIKKRVMSEVQKEVVGTVVAIQTSTTSSIINEKTEFSDSDYNPYSPSFASYGVGSNNMSFQQNVIIQQQPTMGNPKPKICVPLEIKLRVPGCY